MGSILASKAASRGSGASSLRSMISVLSGCPASSMSLSSSRLFSASSSIRGGFWFLRELRLYPSGNLDGVVRASLHTSAKRSSVWVCLRRPGPFAIGMRQMSSPGGEDRRGGEGAGIGGGDVSSATGPSWRLKLSGRLAFYFLGERRPGVPAVGGGLVASSSTKGRNAGPVSSGSSSALALLSGGPSSTSKFWRYSSPRHERSASTGGVCEWRPSSPDSWDL